MEVRRHGPWTVTGSSIKYKSPWMTVREDSVLGPDEKPTTFGVVELRPGVSVLPLDTDGTVYLTRGFHYALGAEAIEAVSGGIDAGETPQAAAARELEEELGIRAREWTALGRTDPFTTSVDSPAYLFLARSLVIGEKKNDPHEVVTLVRVPLSEAVEMVMKSVITHTPSALLILKTDAYPHEE